MVSLSWPLLLLLGCLQTSITRKYEIMSAVRMQRVFGPQLLNELLYNEVLDKTNEPT